MDLIVIFVFLGVFAVVALLTVASGTGASQQAKQMLGQTRLGPGHDEQVGDEPTCWSMFARTNC